MTLRYLIATIFILVSFRCFSQRTDIEEIVMDYYIKNIREKGDKLRSTGKLEIQKGNYVAYIVAQYLVCKRRHAKDTAETRYFYNEYVRLGANVIGELDTLNLKYLTIRLKDPITKVQRLKFQKLRGGLIGLCRRTTGKVFGEPFNVFFFRHIKFEEHYYTMIEVAKKDGEYGRQFWFRLNNRGEVLDWCEGGWIQ